MIKQKYFLQIAISLVFLIFPSALIADTITNILQTEDSDEKYIHGFEKLEESDIDKLTIDSIKLSGEYIKKVIKDDGSFEYINFLNSSLNDKDYNELRHAGTIYSLQLYHEMFPDKSNVELIKLASKYLIDCCIREVKEGNNLKAVWTKPYITFDPPKGYAKLGGAGLGLVALVGLKKIDNEAVDIELLRELGNFILFLQKDNGSFYSRYMPENGGRNDEWTSLYYPGEAALGLAMLYEIDKNKKWIDASIKAITYLAEIRQNKPDVPPDHWAMIATNKIFSLSKENKIEFPRELFIEHATQVCISLLEEFYYKNWDGSYLSKPLISGRIAPIGTRLEGLIAAYEFLPGENTVLRKQILEAIDKGIKFLAAVQVVNGEYRGGFTKKVTYYSGRKTYSISREIRIDYVQHAVSAQINYILLFSDQKK